jgi:dipeptide/tripeptide permease
MSYADSDADENRALLEDSQSPRHFQNNLGNDHANTITDKLSFFDPRRKFYRYFTLIFICFLLFGTYFCYVLPGALENEFERDLKISTSQFTVFNSLYSWPNIFLCFFGGFLIDRVLGNRLGAILFSSFVSIGQLMFAYGAFTKNLTLMYIGTFVFG